MKIRNKVVLVTGASGGIGSAFSRMCARHGANLILVVRTKLPDFELELRTLGAPSVDFLEVDLSIKDQLENLVSKISQIKIDILFNNAGLLTGGLLEQQTSQEIDRMLHVNVNALIHLTRAVLPEMVQRKSGKIINNASVSALMYFPCATTYAASKAAVSAFTQALSIELKGTGVSTLLLITPGIKTRMFDQITPLYGKHLEVPDKGLSPDEYARRIEKCILKDQEIYYPPFFSLEGMGLWAAKYIPRTFKMAVQMKFRRD